MSLGNNDAIIEACSSTLYVINHASEYVFRDNLVIMLLFSFTPLFRIR
jgi:hypothetical protein